MHAHMWAWRNAYQVSHAIIWYFSGNFKLESWLGLYRSARGTAGAHTPGHTLEGWLVIQCFLFFAAMKACVVHVRVGGHGVTVTVTITVAAAATVAATVTHATVCRRILHRPRRDAVALTLPVHRYDKLVEGGTALADKGRLAMRVAPLLVLRTHGGVCVQHRQERASRGEQARSKSGCTLSVALFERDREVVT